MPTVIHDQQDLTSIPKIISKVNVNNKTATGGPQYGW